MPRRAPIAIVYGLHPQPCRGLRAGVFTDSSGQRHDLAKEKPVSAKQASADARMPDTPRAVLALVRAGQLYPVRKENARVIRIYPCAIADYWARQTRPQLKRTA